MKMLSAAQMKELDRAAINSGVPSAELMETAARQVFLAALACLGSPDGALVAIFCGVGNNGGDGVAAARFLREAGVQVRAFLVGDREKMTPDTWEMEQRLEVAGETLEEFDPDDLDQRSFCEMAHVMIDALFGIGLRSVPKGDAAAAIRLMNGCRAAVIAVDMPSGVEADTGRILGAAVQADQTVTFTLPKPGQFTGEGSLCCGKVRVVEIGIPKELVEAAEGRAFVLTQQESIAMLPRRKQDGHKGDFGRVGLVAGSIGYTGAPTLAAKAAARSGAGLVFLHVPGSIYEIEAVKNTEVMVFPIETGGDELAPGAADGLLPRLSTYDACLIGPGLGQSEGARIIVGEAIERLAIPLVLDADGLNLLAAHIDLLDRRSAPTILTPHAGEFARLGGDLSDGDRIGAARRFVKTHPCILVLKGHGTVIALPDGQVYVNPTGNSGMAKGGSGDVLSGVLLALLGQGMAPEQAAAAAVYFHGAAGDRCAEHWGEAGFLPGDLIEALPQVMRTQKRADGRKQ